MAALANVSPSRHGLHFKAKSKEMTRLASELSRLGSRSVMETPQLVVCGDQSAGKSSVIQRLCGVNLPRSEGTCTRCPMEIRLLVDDSENATWACKVSIRTEFDERTGQPVKPHEAVFIDGIKDKSKVEKVIRRAQKAILNPSQGMEQFMVSESAVRQQA